MCACVSSCGMLSLQEELSGTSGTNQKRRAQGHEGSEERLEKKENLTKEKGGGESGESEEESGV